MEQSQVPPLRRSKRSLPEPEPELVAPGFGIIDILPLILCIGIVVLLYFLVREFQSEQENQEARYTSLAKRLESLEKTDDPVVPDAAPQNGSVWASSEAAETVDRAQKNGTYVLKNSVVSFEPEDKDDLPPVVELPEESESDEESQGSGDGDFA